jgi:hypothetical protein
MSTVIFDQSNELMENTETDIVSVTVFDKQEGTSRSSSEGLYIVVTRYNPDECKHTIPRIYIYI